MKRAVLILLLVGHSARAADLADYDPRSQAWNGMASFVGLAEGMGFEVSPVTQLEWGELTADDILVLIYPLQRVEPSKLGAFVQAGGNVVIADDFGEAKDAMAGLGLLRADVGAPRASKYYAGRVWAPIAFPVAKHHPLADDVDEVVTNYPAALRQIEGATTVIGFDDGALVVAGERGTGRFVAISDPSIFINRMQQFRGNVQLATNLLRWLGRDGRSRHVVLLRGDVSMYGDPPAFVDDPHGGAVARSVAAFNKALSDARWWFLTSGALKALGIALAATLLLLALAALPVRRGPNIDGAWLRFGRPARRDEPHSVLAAAERLGRRDSRSGALPRGEAAAGSLLVVACILRDQVQAMLEAAIDRPEPLYTVAEAELVAAVSTARGAGAGIAIARVYRRLRALPSRGQAAAPWSSGHLSRREFDALYRDVAELCSTLGQPLVEASERKP